MEKNKCCPANCRGIENITEISRLFKGVLNGIKLKCTYGCEVPLLSYVSHVTKCEEDNREVECWNCGKKSKNYIIKMKEKEEVNKIKQELQDLMDECSSKDKEISNYNYEYEKYFKEIKSIKTGYDKTILSLKKEYQELFSRHSKMTYIIETSKEKKHYYEEIIFLIELPICTTIINPNHSDFLITNNGKTIKKVSGKDSWFGFFGADKVPLKGVQEFSFRIDHMNEYASMMIGFAVGGTNPTNGIYANDSSWMCYLYGGKFYNAGNDNDYFCCRNMIVRPLLGDNMSICINTKTFVLFVKINGKVLPTELKMNIDESKKGNLYPCFDLSRLNDQITLVP